MRAGRGAPLNRDMARAGLMLAAEMLARPCDGGALKGYVARAETGRGWTRIRNELSAAVSIGWLDLVAPAGQASPAIYRVSAAGRAELASIAERAAALAVKAAGGAS